LPVIEVASGTRGLSVNGKTRPCFQLSDCFWSIIAQRSLIHPDVYSSDQSTRDVFGPVKPSFLIVCVTLSGAIDMSSTAKEVNFVIPRSWSHEHTIAEKKKRNPKSISISKACGTSCATITQPQWRLEFPCTTDRPTPLMVWIREHRKAYGIAIRLSKSRQTLKTHVFIFDREDGLVRSADDRLSHSEFSILCDIT